MKVREAWNLLKDEGKDGKALPFDQSREAWAVLNRFGIYGDSLREMEQGEAYEEGMKTPEPEAPCPPLCPSDCPSRRACEEDGDASLREEAGQVPPGIGVDVTDAGALAYQDKPPLDELDPEDRCECGDPDCTLRFDDPDRAKDHHPDLDEAEARSVREDELYHEAKDEGRVRPRSRR